MLISRSLINKLGEFTLIFLSSCVIVNVLTVLYMNEISLYLDNNGLPEVFEGIGLFSVLRFIFEMNCAHYVNLEHIAWQCAEMGSVFVVKYAFLLIVGVILLFFGEKLETDKNLSIGVLLGLFSTLVLVFFESWLIPVGLVSLGDAGFLISVWAIFSLMRLWREWWGNGQ